MPEQGGALLLLQPWGNGKEACVGQGFGAIFPAFPSLTQMGCNLSVKPPTFQDVSVVTAALMT